METSTLETVPAPPKSSTRWFWALSAPVWLLPIWFLLAWTLPNTPFATVNGYLIAVLIGVCAYTDLLWGKIRNWATYTALLWALALNVVETFVRQQAAISGDDEGETRGFDIRSASHWSEALGGVGIWESLIGAILAFVVMLFIYRLAGGGAGDLKLAAALGALLGPAAVVEMLVWSYVIASVSILCYVIVVIGPGQIFGGLARKVGSSLAPARVSPPSAEQDRLLQGKIRLAPFFALGTVLVLSGATRWFSSTVLGG